jgi:hypothetical protein
MILPHFQEVLLQVESEHHTPKVPIALCRHLKERTEIGLSATDRNSR